MWLLSKTIVACSLVAGYNVGASVRVIVSCCELAYPERAQALAYLVWRVSTSPYCLRVIAVDASFEILWFLSCRGGVMPAGCVLVLDGRSVLGCCSHSWSSLVGDVSWSVSLSLLVPQSSELVPWVGV